MRTKTLSSLAKLTNGYQSVWIACLCTTLLMLSGCQSYTTGLQQSTARAEEITAVTTLRTISAAQRAYSLSNEGQFGTFPQLAEGGFLDARFGAEAPEFQGYVLTMNVGDKEFSCNADPVEGAEHGGRHFYLDSSTALIRVNPGQPAKVSDPAFQP